MDCLTCSLSTERCRVGQERLARDGREAIVREIRTSYQEAIRDFEPISSEIEETSSRPASDPTEIWRPWTSK